MVVPKSLVETVDLDLFAGGGGLACGLASAGFLPLHLFEKDKVSCETLRHNARSNRTNFPATVYETDVNDIDWRPYNGQVRLLAAGAPCQPFSLGGKHKASEDGRNLFPEVLRAVRETRPAAVLLENVRGLLRQDFLPYFEYILRQLECPSVRPTKMELWQDHDTRLRRHQCSVGYQPEYWVTRTLLNAADFGVAQVRMRVFVVATRYELPPFRFPAATHCKAALLLSQSDGCYWRRHGLKAPTSQPIQLFTKGHNNLLPWRTVRDELASLPLPADSEERSTMNHWRIPGARSYAAHSGSKWDFPAKTIKAGVHGVPGGENTVSDGDDVRYFTLRELARLQSFPDTHVFSGARIHVTRQIGNAVPCKLAEAIARPLFEMLKTKLREQRPGGNYAATVAGI